MVTARGERDGRATDARRCSEVIGPYDLTATPGIGSATISFTAGSDHGYEITNYLYSTDGVDYVPLSPADAASPVTITGLTSNEGVSITLKALRVMLTPSLLVSPVMVTGLAASAGLRGT